MALYRAGKKSTMRQINLFNLVKNTIWSSVLDTKVEKSDQTANLALLLHAMREIKVLIELHQLLTNGRLAQVEKYA